MKISSKYNFDSIIPISAKTNQNIDDLVTKIEDNLPENEHIYDEKFMVNSNDNKFMISELIREKIIRNLGDELPHDTFVEIEEIESKNKTIHISAVIYVNRKSQKHIVIGSNGDLLKKIGKEARQDIENFLNNKVFLKTWVKVKRNWNTDSSFIYSLGVGNNYESN